MACVEGGSMKLAHRPLWLPALLAAAIFSLALWPQRPVSAAQAEKPRTGGDLVFAVGGTPPSFDGHRETTFAMLHPLAPRYSTLLRFDPQNYPKIIGDVAEDKWTISRDGLTYTFKIRKGIKFHDGSDLTSKDVKATYDKIIFPPEGVASARQASYGVVKSIEAPDPYTVVFQLKQISASFIANLASPWNWIYKADILAKDPRWYEKNVMGTGPFKFVEYVRGSHWVGKKNADYWDKGKPYLDGYRILFIRDPAAQVAAIRGERAMVQFRGFSPAERDQLVSALGSKITVQESPWNCSIQVALNQEKKPFNDKRVRRALTLALDRWSGSKALSRIAVVKEVAGIQVPGTPWATPTEELMKLAGYGTDINAARAEARRLLKEAGAEGLSFTLTNRAVPQPYEPVGVWLIDQWRQIGVNVKQVMLESAAWLQVQKNGEHEVSTNAPCNSIVEPDMDLHWYLTTSPVNFSRHKDTVMDELYAKQSRATDPDERRRYLRAFE